MLRRLVLAIGSMLSNNARAQRLLDRAVRGAQYFMGIGAGSMVAQSGEASVLGQIFAAQPDPLTIIDVGANKGQFLALARSILGNRAYHIHSFEPSPTAFAILAAVNGSAAGVTLNNCGLSRAEGVATLYTNEPASELASLSLRRLDHIDITFTAEGSVQLDTLDTYCTRQAITRIDLLKLDVEGHELEILHGAVRMFQAGAIRAVTFEFGGCNIDSRTFFQDFYYFFTERGMKISRITPSGFLVPIERYRESDEQFRTVNYLAVH